MVTFELDDSLAEIFLDVLVQAQMKALEGQEEEFEKVKEMTIAATMSEMAINVLPTRLTNGIQIDMQSAKERVEERISKLVAKKQQKEAMEEVKSAAEALLRQVKVFQDHEEENEVKMFPDWEANNETGDPLEFMTIAHIAGVKRKREREEEDVEAKFNELTEARNKWRKIARKNNAGESNTGRPTALIGGIVFPQDVNPARATATVKVKVEDSD